MPIYEYRCQECGHEMEAMQRISADALTTCPECGSEGLKRLISQTSFVLKGGGWYATDYGGKTPSDAKTDDSAPPANSEGTASETSAPSSTSSD